MGLNADYPMNAMVGLGFARYPRAAMVTNFKRCCVLLLVVEQPSHERLTTTIRTNFRREGEKSRKRKERKVAAERITANMAAEGDAIDAVRWPYRRRVLALLNSSRPVCQIC